MARNQYKKITFEDKFGRKYFCKHANAGLRKTEDKQNKKKMRRYEKNLIRKFFKGEY